MNKEQEKLLSHLKYMLSLANDWTLEKAIRLIEELAEEVEQLKKPGSVSS